MMKNEVNWHWNYEYLKMCLNEWKWFSTESYGTSNLQTYDQYFYLPYRNFRLWISTKHWHRHTENLHHTTRSQISGIERTDLMNWNLIEPAVAFFFNGKVCFAFKRVRRRPVKLHHRLQDRSAGEGRESNTVVMNSFWTFWSPSTCLCLLKVCLPHVHYE